MFGQSELNTISMLFNDNRGERQGSRQLYCFGKWLEFGTYILDMTWRVVHLLSMPLPLENRLENVS
jgi:hypothetical protein